MKWVKSSWTYIHIIEEEENQERDRQTSGVHRQRKIDTIKGQKETRREREQGSFLRSLTTNVCPKSNL